jgi:hypothetical protein
VSRFRGLPHSRPRNRHCTRVWSIMIVISPVVLLIRLIFCVSVFSFRIAIRTPSGKPSDRPSRQPFAHPSSSPTSRPSLSPDIVNVYIHSPYIYENVLSLDVLSFDLISDTHDVLARELKLYLESESGVRFLMKDVNIKKKFIQLKKST